MGSSWTTNDNPTVFNITYAGGPALPIELISFTGNRRDAVIELRWRTGSEFNNYYMAVERSADGIEFAEIGRVQGLGTTDGVKDYAFTDHAPFNGINYYRLRQVDFDGTTEIHPTISVLFKGEASFGLYLYPNPATDQIQVRLDGATDQETKIRIFDLMGREYARFTIPAGAFQKELPVHALPAGTFFLQAVQGGKTATGKVVKQ